MCIYKPVRMVQFSLYRKSFLLIPFLLSKSVLFTLQLYCMVITYCFQTKLICLSNQSEHTEIDILQYITQLHSQLYKLQLSKALVQLNGQQNFIYTTFNILTRHYIMLLLLFLYVALLKNEQVNLSLPPTILQRVFLWKCILYVPKIKLNSKSHNDACAMVLHRCCHQ